MPLLIQILPPRLYGITLTQTYIYWINITNDPKWLKVWVSILWSVYIIVMVFPC